MHFSVLIYTISLPDFIGKRVTHTPCGTKTNVRSKYLMLNFLKNKICVRMCCKMKSSTLKSPISALHLAPATYSHFFPHLFVNKFFIVPQSRKNIHFLYLKRRLLLLKLFLLVGKTTLSTALNEKH